MTSTMAATRPGMVNSLAAMSTGSPSSRSVADVPSGDVVVQGDAVGAFYRDVALSPSPRQPGVTLIRTAPKEDAHAREKSYRP